MTEDPFESPFLLLNRAREIREELNARGKAFFDSEPYATFVDRDPNTGHYLRKMRLTEKLPPSSWPVAADALNNLRAALDQGICATVSLLRPNSPLNGVSFVFGNSQAHFENAVFRALAPSPLKSTRSCAFSSLTREGTICCGRSTTCPAPTSTAPS